MQTSQLIERAKAFIAAVGAGAAPEAIAAFYAPDVIQEEFPNRLLPNGIIRDLAALHEAAARGRQVMSAQTYDIVNTVGAGNCVALELIWTGTLAIGFGALKPGDTMRARFAQFFEFKDGLILRQRNYDCFDPW
jgi:ketosteroid isomerase-like protein